MFDAYQKIYITGAAGWLGSNFLNELLKQTQLPIRCFVLPGQKFSLEVGRVECVEGDVRYLRDCERFLDNCKNGLLIHLAGIIHPARFIKELYEVNSQGTQHLLEIASRNGLKRMVVMSSNSPIGINPHEDHCFDELSPYQPYMNYGKSKVQVEMAVKAFQGKNGLETVIIRSPWFYGPNQPERQTLFFKMIQAGKFPIVGNGNNRRSMAYVDNITQGILLAANHPNASGEIFWIADERPYSMNEILFTIKTLLQDEFYLKIASKNLRLPYIAGEVATFIDASIQKLGLYNQKIHVLSEMNKTIACTIEKAKRILGYQPQIDLKEGMRRSIRWCIKMGYL